MKRLSFLIFLLVFAVEDAYCNKTQGKTSYDTALNIFLEEVDPEFANKLKTLCELNKNIPSRAFTYTLAPDVEWPVVRGAITNLLEETNSHLASTGIPAMLEEMKNNQIKINKQCSAKREQLKSSTISVRDKSLEDVTYSFDKENVQQRCSAVTMKHFTLQNNIIYTLGVCGTTKMLFKQSYRAASDAFKEYSAANENERSQKVKNLEAKTKLCKDYQEKLLNYLDQVENAYKAYTELCGTWEDFLLKFKKKVDFDRIQLKRDEEKKKEEEKVEEKKSFEMEEQKKREIEQKQKLEMEVQNRKNKGRDKHVMKGLLGSVFSFGCKGRD